MWEFELFLNKMKLEAVSIFLILLNVTIYIIDGSGRGSGNRRGRPKFPMVRKMLRGSSEVNSNLRYKEEKNQIL